MLHIQLVESQFKQFEIQWMFWIDIEQTEINRNL